MQIFVRTMHGGVGGGLVVVVDGPGRLRVQWMGLVLHGTGI